jgi:extradiol dioxygenase family protein
MENILAPFHLAFPVKNLIDTETFYIEILGCSLGRTNPNWIDFNFYGHQITAHLSPESFNKEDVFNKVDGKDVPVRHFGLILNWTDWHTIKDHLIKKNVAFIIDPYIRFEGEKGEQATLFIADPSSNGIELKSFKEKEMIFSS